MARERQIVIAGAGIAGLTAALAFAARGFTVDICERAPKLEEAGAGLQLAPNATHILARLGVLDTLLADAVEPKAVVLRDARTLGEVARVPLDMARQRWKSPYLVAHRADLQSALISHIRRHDSIRLTTNAEAGPVEIGAEAIVVPITCEGRVERKSAELMVAADGVWSATRAFMGGTTAFAGDIAWRATLPAESPVGEALTRITGSGVVTAFMHPSAHLIVYPIRAGRSLNLVALTRDPEVKKGTAPAIVDPGRLESALRGTASEILCLSHEAGPWTFWPLHMAKADSWTYQGRVALVGDAAHALTPFAAQGAAMAIEDAAVLAHLAGAMPDDLPGALKHYEALRRPRIERVARRGAFNRFAWHASGPVAVARNLVLGMLSPARLVSDLDWLYGWRAP